MISSFIDHFAERLEQIPVSPTARDIAPLAIALLYHAWDEGIRIGGRAVWIGNTEVDSPSLRSLPAAVEETITDIYTEQPTSVGSVFDGNEPDLESSIPTAADAIFLHAIREWLAHRLQDYLVPDADSAVIRHEAAKLAVAAPYLASLWTVLPETEQLLGDHPWLTESFASIRPAVGENLGKASATKYLLRMWLLVEWRA